MRSVNDDWLILRYNVHFIYMAGQKYSGYESIIFQSKRCYIIKLSVKICRFFFESPKALINTRVKQAFKLLSSYYNQFNVRLISHIYNFCKS